MVNEINVNQDYFKDHQITDSLKSQILEDAPVLIAFHSTDNEILWVNKAYREASVKSMQELKGKKCYEVWGLDKLCNDCPVSESIKTGKPVQFDLKPNSQTHWTQDRGSWSSLATPFKDEKNNIIGVIETRININRQKEAEDELNKSQDMLRNYFEFAPFGIFITDREGNYIDVNKQAAEITGYSKEELLNMNLIELIPEEDKSIAQESFRRLTEDANSISTEIRYSRKDGEVRYWRVSAVKIPGNLFLGYTDDITELKESKSKLNETIEELRTNEEELLTKEAELISMNRELNYQKNEKSAMLELMLNAFVLFESVFDDNGDFISYRFIYINKAFEQITGVEQEEVEGRTVHEVWPETEDEWIERYGEVAVTGQPQEFELFHKPTNKLYHCKVYRPFDTEEKFCVIFEDITQLRQQETEDEKFERLESLGILAGGIAHDFNNLLTAILGNITIAKEDAPESIRSILSDAEEATINAKRLTSRLITFSKGGKPVIEQFSIKEMAVNTVDFVLRGSNVKPVYEIADNLWYIKADIGQIEQVINNLTLNARQSMPEGGEIILSLDNVVLDDSNRNIPLRPGHYIELNIRDSGVGIPEDYINKVFDPYFSTKDKGSGLGLSSVYSIIKNHNGHIAVESSSRGSIFTVYLPATSEKLEEVTMNKEEPDESLKMKPGNILIMDDNEMVRETIQRILEKKGWHVTLTKDGEEAIRVYEKSMEKNHHFDIVILDLTVQGGMGGEQTIKKLKEINPDVKVIVSSGYSESPVMSNFSKYGFADMLIKPYRAKILSKKLNRLL